MQVLKRNLAKKRGGYLPKKICNFMGCHKLIKYSETYCDEHKKESNERFKTYDNLRRDKRSADFYHSIEWIITREVVKNKYSNIDVYAYYIDNKILAATLVHHIYELKEHWDKRLNIDNLIPVSDISHKIIHLAYKTNKAETQKLLIELRNRWINEFCM